MPSLRPLDGQQFGNLTVLERRGRVGRQVGWLCRCTCGVEIVVAGDKLTRLKKRSCARNGHRWNSVPKVTHPPEYRTWLGMRKRCTDSDPHHAKRYRDKGITVCERWRSFANFYADMGSKPVPEYTIERIDNALGYFKENCRWATSTEQRRNMTCSVYIACEDEQVLLLDICAKLGLDANLIRGRLRNGWTVEDALTRPTRPKLSAFDMQFA